jgi:hypothetical protein
MAEESEIERSAASYAKKLGMMTYKLESRRVAGWPDRLFIWKGHVWFIEFKARDGNLTPLQRHIINDLKAHGASVFVVYSIEAAKEVLDGLRELC